MSCTCAVAYSPQVMWCACCVLWLRLFLNTYHQKIMESWREYAIRHVKTSDQPWLISYHSGSESFRILIRKNQTFGIVVMNNWDVLDDDENKEILCMFLRGNCTFDHKKQSIRTRKHFFLKFRKERCMNKFWCLDETIPPHFGFATTFYFIHWIRFFAVSANT